MAVKAHLEIDYIHPLAHIEVVGSKHFCSTVDTMLRHIEGSCAEKTVSLLKGIREVESYDDTGMGEDGWFDVAIWVLGGTTWGASQIAHDAEHYRRMLTGEFLGLCRQEELEAFKLQIAFLEEKGDFVSAMMVRSMDGSHVDPRANS